MSDMFPPYVRGSGTSRAAAASMLDDAAGLRTRVFEFIHYRRIDGATCWEVESHLAMRHQTASARIRELVLMGGVTDSLKRRVTGSGRMAAVWIAKLWARAENRMYWLAKCPHCLICHEVVADEQPAATLCRHPYHKEREFRMPGALIWQQSPEPQPLVFTFRHPPHTVEIWPESRPGRGCELSGCVRPALSGLPVCGFHAAMAPYPLVRDTFAALEARQGYPRAHVTLMKYVEAARAVIEE
jgi:phage FluMu protein Com